MKPVLAHKRHWLPTHEHAHNTMGTQSSWSVQFARQPLQQSPDSETETMKLLLDRIALFWSSPTSNTTIAFSWDMQTQGDTLCYQSRFTPNCSFSSLCITASIALHTIRHPAHQLGHLLLSSASSSSSSLAGQGEVVVGGGAGGKLSRLGFETKCCGGSTTTQDRFLAHKAGHGEHTGESNSPMKELQNVQHHNHIYNNTFINAHN